LDFENNVLFRHKSKLQHLNFCEGQFRTSVPKLRGETFADSSVKFLHIS